jgi:hypothetical protein
LTGGDGVAQVADGVDERAFEELDAVELRELAD